MTISFEKVDDELILVYAPTYGLDEIEEKLKKDGYYNIKHTFLVSLSQLRRNDDDYDDSLRFRVGNIEGNYVRIDPKVVMTEHSFFFANDINLKQNMFLANRYTSILKTIDSVIKRDLYIGGSWEKVNGLPAEVYVQMLKAFPKTAEIEKYVRSRISSIVKDYIPETDIYEDIYKKYIKNKTKNKKIDSKSNLAIEIEQFTLALEELQELLKNEDGIPEYVWQEKIRSILLLLYPKYILCTREVTFQGVDGYDKRPDFVLVDMNGYIDILEIKKPSVQLLSKQASYRHNYVPVRELSGSIQQIEKYIYCIASQGKDQTETIKKLMGMLPPEVNIDIVNPQGFLIAGRSNSFSEQQRRDFELIKRQYKHITEIVTYDDLIMRLNNILFSLKRRIEKNIVDIRG